MEPTPEREGYDLVLMLLTVVLLLLGTAVILDASFARALQAKALHYVGWFYFKRQLIFLIPAVIALVVGLKTPYWVLRRFWLLGMAAAFVLLVAVLFSHVGIKVGGARRWLGFGLLRFQPSECAKIALVVFLARYSELWRSRISHLTKGFIPPVLVIFATGGLVAKEDLGTAITIIATGLIMMFMMGARPKHIAGQEVLAIIVGTGFVLHKQFRVQRVLAWYNLVVHPLAPLDGVGYQPSQGLIALGSGGLTGQGIMQGTAKHLYLPAEHTDYLFAPRGQDVGLIWCLALLGAFAWMVIRGLAIAHRTRDWFGSLLAAGLTTVIGTQTILNIAVVTGLVPCTGVPLPFISYGGASQ